MTPDKNAVEGCSTGVGPGSTGSKTYIRATANSSKSAPEIAIVGAGLMGRWHLYVARNLGARVVGVVDPDIAAAAALAARAPGARAVTSVRELLNLHAPFAAHVCTPTRRHFEIASELVAAGVHVLVEKPLCQTLEETRTLIAQAQQRGVVVCPVHQYAFQRGIERALDWSNALGSIRRISFDICSAGADGLAPGQRMTVIDEILPHPISILQRLAPATRLGAAAWSIITRTEGEHVAHASANGPIASISISLNARPTSFLTLVETDHGAITIDGFHGFATLSRGRASRLTKLTGPFARSSNTLATAALNLARRTVQRELAYPGLAALVRRFYFAAARGGPPPISTDQIIEAAEVWNKLRTRESLPAATTP